MTDQEVIEVNIDIKICEHRFTRGTNKGKYCGNKAQDETDYCKSHQNCTNKKLVKCTSHHKDNTECVNLTSSKTGKCERHRKSPAKIREIIINPEIAALPEV